MSVLLYKKPIVRQIVFNHALEAFMKVDSPDFSYTPILPYLEQSPGARGKTGAQLSPFLEVLIFVEPPNLSFSVELVSDTELDEKQWRKIGRCVNRHLREFETDISPDLVGRLFHAHMDYKVEEKMRDLWIRFDCALQLKRCFPEIKVELKKMMQKQKLTPAMVAERFDVHVDEIKDGFYAGVTGHVQTARIAKNILLASNLAKAASIFTMSELESDVLYREPSNILPRLKKFFERRRFLVFDVDSDPMKTPLL